MRSREAEFDLVMNVNLHGTLNLLELARAHHHGGDGGAAAPRPRFVMASAGATLGSGAPTDFVSKDDEVGDWTRATPHTSYGMTKASARGGVARRRGANAATGVVAADVAAVDAAQTRRLVAADVSAADA